MNRHDRVSSPGSRWKSLGPWLVHFGGFWLVAHPYRRANLWPLLGKSSGSTDGWSHPHFAAVCLHFLLHFTQPLKVLTVHPIEFSLLLLWLFRLVVECFKLFFAHIYEGQVASLLTTFSIQRPFYPLTSHHALKVRHRRLHSNRFQFLHSWGHYLWLLSFSTCKCLLRCIVRNLPCHSASPGFEMEVMDIYDCARLRLSWGNHWYCRFWFKTKHQCDTDNS